MDVMPCFMGDTRSLKHFVLGGSPVAIGQATEHLAILDPEATFGVRIYSLSKPAGQLFQVFLEAPAVDDFVPLLSYSSTFSIRL